MREPVFHFFADCLPETDPRAWTTLYCVDCDKMVHSIPNETMDAWFDTRVGPVCFDCFASAFRANDYDRFDAYDFGEER